MCKDAGLTKCTLEMGGFVLLSTQCSSDGLGTEGGVI